MNSDIEALNEARANIEALADKFLAQVDAEIVRAGEAGAMWRFHIARHRPITANDLYKDLEAVMSDSLSDIYAGIDRAIDAAQDNEPSEDPHREHRTYSAPLNYGGAWK